jgi:hypothetical protein
MRHKYILIAALAAIPLLFAQPAEASRGDYCREFTKTIRVGGNLESGYGRACLMPDGSWQIVSTHGSLEPHEIFPRDIHRRIVYRDNYYAPRYYQPPRVVYYQPGRHYGHYKHKKHWRDWDDDRRDHHDRDRHHRRDRD